MIILMTVSGDRIRDARRDPESSARAAHHHEDVPDIPGRVSPGRGQAEAGREPEAQDRAESTEREARQVQEV